MLCFLLGIITSDNIATHLLTLGPDIDIATSLSMSGPNVSRCVAMLSDVMIPSRKTQSLGLVELSTDPMDRRVRYVQLSQKGEEFVNQITANF